MLIILAILNLFGPLVGQSTIIPRNEFKGFGIVLPSAYGLLSNEGDSSKYLVGTSFGVYYNMDRHLTLGTDISGRFIYINSDSTTNAIYPDVIKVGAKFGFPLSKNADLGVAAYAGVPLHVFGLKDTIDLLGYPLAKRAFPGMELYCHRYLGRFNLFWNAGYSGWKLRTHSSELHYESTVTYGLNGVRPFVGFKAHMYTGNYNHRIPYDIKTYLGVSFISEFNAAFTIAFFARPFSNIISHDIYIPDSNFKYGLIVNIESWIVNSKYRRKFKPRNEKPAKLVLIRRFVNLRLNVFDKDTRTPLTDVKVRFMQDSKSVKSLVFNEKIKVDSIRRGTYKVVFEKDRYIPDTFDLKLYRDTSITVYLKKRQLKDTGWLLLTITDIAGKPLAGAVVSIVDLGIKAKTDSSGRVIFKVKSGRYLVNIKHSGYRSITRYFVINKEEKTKRTIRLRRK